MCLGVEKLIDVIAGCADNVGDFGSNNPVGEDPDSISIVIDVPANIGEDIVVDEEICTNQYSYEHEIGDSSSREASYQVRGRNVEEVAKRFYFDDFMGVWYVNVTAHTAGSLVGTGLNPDEELYAGVQIYFYGFYSVVTLVESEEEEEEA